MTAFAASGTCVAVQGKQNAWFGTGGAVARVFRSVDGGEHWAVAETPIIHGEASQGIFSVDFWQSLQGIAVGGDYKNPNSSTANVVKTDDDGKHWKLVSSPR